METTIPVLDQKLLQEKTNEAAMKGALKAIEDFYNAYDSPYKKAITEGLKDKGLNGSLELPNVLAVLNDSLAKEIDKIANTAIAQTFIPMVKKFLTREESEMTMTDFLKKCIEASEVEEYYKCDLDISLHERHGWYNCTLKLDDKTYEFTLHEDYNSKKEGKAKYILLSMPRDTSDGKYSQKMTLIVDGAKLEMPFQSDILKDDVINFMCRLVLTGTLITMDTTNLDEDMFPEKCHC